MFLYLQTRDRNKKSKEIKAIKLTVDENSRNLTKLSPVRNLHKTDQIRGNQSRANLSG